MNKRMLSILGTIIILLHFFSAPSAAITIPRVYTNIKADGGTLYIMDGEQRYPLIDETPRYSLRQMMGSPRGTDNGTVFDFGDLNGWLYYGFIKHGDSAFPHPVFYEKPQQIRDGWAEIRIIDLTGNHDLIEWKKTGRGTIGYRVIDNNGTMLYDGKVFFAGSGPFKVDAAICQGPFVNRLTHNSAVISFDTNMACTARVTVGDQTKQVFPRADHFEVPFEGLLPGTRYFYEVALSTDRNFAYTEKYWFETAPAPGTRTAFTFSYASDSRSGPGGGERDFRGVNAYIMKKIGALCRMKRAVFLQFTGDLITGAGNSIAETDLEYANWKKAVAPFAHYFPVYAAMGNHDIVLRIFNDGSEHGHRIDRFPFATESSEAVFGRHFVNPLNGPLKENGSGGGSESQAGDMPTYKENVYSYTYDNIAMVVLNSNYLYSPALRKKQNHVGGNIHGYIMDRQLEWLDAELQLFGADKNIDHVFVSVHTPVLPNGGHVRDAMYYHGNDRKRPVIAGTPYAEGIISRRDRLLKLLMKSKKVRAVLTGDEHNYSRIRITGELNLYPDGWSGKRLKAEDFRPIWQINNGAAGAPYYALEKTPWRGGVEKFTAQYALVLVHVNASSLELEVINPDTLECIERISLN